MKLKLLFKDKVLRTSTTFDDGEIDDAMIQGYSDNGLSKTTIAYLGDLSISKILQHDKNISYEENEADNPDYNFLGESDI